MAARPVSGGDLRQRKPCPLHGFRAGLHDGDLLLQLENGARGPVTDQIARTKPGTRATIRFQRGSERKQAVIIVADELAFYSRAAARGDHTAETIIGEIYAWGYGVPANTLLGISWLQKAAEAGDAAAQDDLGTLYFKG